MKSCSHSRPHAQNWGRGGAWRAVRRQGKRSKVCAALPRLPRLRTTKKFLSIFFSPMLPGALGLERAAAARDQKWVICALFSGAALVHSTQLLAKTAHNLARPCFRARAQQVPVSVRPAAVCAQPRAPQPRARPQAV
jgi:hypothetical protein